MAGRPPGRARPGGVLFWNHPGWRGQQKDGVARWHPDHDEILEAGLLDGVEVVNAREYDPEAHAWALEKSLAILASSDIHDPVSLSWNLHEGDHRPVTLVFAKERSEAGLKEALFACRTVAWSGPKLVGREELIRPLVAAAVVVENPRLSIAAGSEGWLRIRNASDLRLELTRTVPVEELAVPAHLVIARDGRSFLEIRVPKVAAPGPLRLQLDWTVRNVLVAPGEGLAFPLVVEVEVLPPAP